jgi:hypothetical protein
MSRVIATRALLIGAVITIAAPASALDPRFNGLTIQDVGEVARVICPMLPEHMISDAAARANAHVVMSAVCALGKDPTQARHTYLNMACIDMKKRYPSIGNLPENTFEGKMVNACKLFGIDDWNSY